MSSQGEIVRMDRTGVRPWSSPMAVVRTCLEMILVTLRSCSTGQPKLPPAVRTAVSTPLVSPSAAYAASWATATPARGTPVRRSGAHLPLVPRAEVGFAARLPPPPMAYPL